MQCAYRTKKLIRFFWFDLYNEKEMKIAIIGIILSIVGFAAFILLSSFFGYYYYDGNLHQWILTK